MKYNKIGIIVAMTKEYELVKSTLQNTVENEVHKFKFCTGSLGDKQIILMKSGIGKVNAAVASIEMIEIYTPDCIINTGVAGGIDRSLNVADIVIGEQTTYHDYYAGDVADHIKELGFPVNILADASMLNSLRTLGAKNNGIKFGLICTGDQFITNNVVLEQIKAKHPSGLAVDMESNSIAHVCFLRDVPFLSFRIISDTPWVDNHNEQYLNFWESAPQKNFSLLSGLIKNI
jgi:adenosylhomocysteine nucleosidase